MNSFIRSLENFMLSAVQWSRKSKSFGIWLYLVNRWEIVCTKLEHFEYSPLEKVCKAINQSRRLSRVAKFGAEPALELDFKHHAPAEDNVNINLSGNNIDYVTQATQSRALHDWVGFSFHVNGFTLSSFFGKWRSFDLKFEHSLRCVASKRAKNQQIFP